MKYYIEWTNDFHVETVSKYATRGKKYNSIQDSDFPTALAREESARGCSATNYTCIDFPGDFKHVYVVTTKLGTTSLSDYESLYIEATFKDVMQFVDDNYTEEHQYDPEECTLCKKIDGPERCLLRAKAKLAIKRLIEFNDQS